MKAYDPERDFLRVRDFLNATYVYWGALAPAYSALRVGGVDF
jgi:hypothetical protein